MTDPWFGRSLGAPKLDQLGLCWERVFRSEWQGCMIVESIQMTHRFFFQTPSKQKVDCWVLGRYIYIFIFIFLYIYTDDYRCFPKEFLFWVSDTLGGCVYRSTSHHLLSLSLEPRRISHGCRKEMAAAGATRMEKVLRDGQWKD